jgi:hypothetical protein
MQYLIAKYGTKPNVESIAVGRSSRVPSGLRDVQLVADQTQATDVKAMDNPGTMPDIAP